MVNPTDVLGTACNPEREHCADAVGGRVVFNLVFQFENEVPVFRMAVHEVVGKFSKMVETQVCINGRAETLVRCGEIPALISVENGKFKTPQAGFRRIWQTGSAYDLTESTLGQGFIHMKPWKWKLLLRPDLTLLDLKFQNCIFYLAKQVMVPAHAYFLALVMTVHIAVIVTEQR